MVMLLQPRPPRHTWVRALIVGAIVVALIVAYARAEPAAVQGAGTWVKEAPESDRGAAVAVPAGCALAATQAADWLEAAGDRAAIDWRRQAVWAEPDRIEARLALVHSALRVEDLVVAQRALADLPVEAMPTLDYALARAALTAVGGERANAMALIEVRLGQGLTAETLPVQRDVHTLRYGRKAAIAEARGRLQQVAAGSAQAAVARRALAQEACRQGAAAAALKHAEALAGRADAGFGDRLFLANLRLHFRTMSLMAVKDGLRAQPPRTPEEAAAWIGWLVARGEAAAVPEALAVLPVAVRESLAAGAAEAEAAVAIRDWPRAWGLIRAGAWGGVLPEAAALAAAATNEAEWMSAVRAAGDDVSSLRVLHRVALARGREGDRAAVAWVLAQDPAAAPWGGQLLVELRRAAQDTQGLIEAYRRVRAVEGEASSAEDHLVLLSALTADQPTLELRAQLERRCLLNPGSSVLAAARGLVLWQQGRIAEALAATEGLKPVVRQQPESALYHGIFLLENGRVRDGEAYLALVRPGELLPEEGELLRRAQALAKRGAAGKKQRGSGR